MNQDTSTSSRRGLSIVIVNWNTGDLLRECLTSISTARLPLGWALERIVVVDNASSDDSVERIEPIPLPLEIVRNQVNRGFGAACNQGAQCGNSELLLFLNPDTRLLEESLVEPIQALTEAASPPGIVGVQLLDAEGNISVSCARFPRATHFVVAALGIDRIWPRLAHLMVDWDHRDTRTVDQVMGAFFMTRRNLFETLGGFDERFFVYFEEVDFALRAQRLGWTSLFLSGTQAYHIGGGSSSKVRDRRLMYQLRSRVLYANKHYRMPELTLVHLTVWILEPLTRTMFALARGRLGDVLSVWNGYRLLVRTMWRNSAASP
jgi:N-acetylglucosaminyl-diphospho-decaprenol L-rhamnosyltransferase